MSSVAAVPALDLSPGLDLLDLLDLNLDLGPTPPVAWAVVGTLVVRAARAVEERLVAKEAETTGGTMEVAVASAAA